MTRVLVACLALAGCGPGSAGFVIQGTCHLPCYHPWQSCPCGYPTYVPETDNCYAEGDPEAAALCDVFQDCVTCGD